MRRLAVLLGVLALSACSLVVSLDDLRSGSAKDGGPTNDAPIGPDGAITGRWCNTQDAMICADFDDNVPVIPMFQQTQTGLGIQEGGLSAPNLLGTKTAFEKTTQLAASGFPPKELSLSFDVFFPVTNSLGEKVDIVQFALQSFGPTASFFVEYESGQLKIVPPQGQGPSAKVQFGRWIRVSASVQLQSGDGGGTAVATLVVEGVPASTTPVNIGFVSDRSQTSIGIVNHTTNGPFDLRIDNVIGTLR